MQLQSRGNNKELCGTALLLLPSASFKEQTSVLTLPMVHTFSHLLPSLLFFENHYLFSSASCTGPLTQLKTPRAVMAEEA